MSELPLCEKLLPEGFIKNPETYTEGTKENCYTLVLSDYKKNIKGLICRAIF